MRKKSGKEADFRTGDLVREVDLRSRRCEFECEDVDIVIEYEIESHYGKRILVQVSLLTGNLVKFMPLHH